MTLSCYFYRLGSSSQQTGWCGEREEQVLYTGPTKTGGDGEPEKASLFLCQITNATDEWRMIGH